MSTVDPNPHQSDMTLQARIDSLEKELQVLSRDVAEDEQARQKLLAATQQATAMLETPPETIWRLLLQVSALLTHARNKIVYSMLMLWLTTSPI